MCGIVYVQRKDNKTAVKQVLKRYKAQKARGSEGFGYVAIKQSGRATESHRFMTEHEVRTKLESTKHSHILFHHRYPTSTPNVPESAHPIPVTHAELQYDYYVVHNGVITNDEKVKPEHDKLGYVYTTEICNQFVTQKGTVYNDGTQYNDSETLAIELARNIEGLTNKVKTEGSIAYIVLQMAKDTHQAIALYYGTNGGNTLTLDDTKEFTVIASEGGKAINDNICYRMSLPDGTTTEYLQVQVPAMHRAPAVGYNTTQTKRPNTAWPYGSEYGSYDEYDYPRPKSYKHSRTLNTIEDDMADLEQEIIGLQGDVAYSLAEGDIEESEMFQTQLDQAKKQKADLEKEYLAKA